MKLRNTAKKLKTEEIDRISALPDEVVSQILCFLSTKQAVATSVLSKRWRSLWTLAPDLHYDRGSFKIHSTRRRQETEGFLRFFRDRVKRLDKSFGLVRLHGFFDDRLGDLVMEIMARKVRELDVATVAACAKFHYSRLSSETLVSLKLYSISFPVGLSVYLPRLKILHLNWVENISEEAISEFISGCPVLEDFLLRNCRGYRSLPLILFTSQTLLSLELAYGIDFPCPSSIHLPCLKNLHLETSRMVNPEYISQLLSGCPSLENFLAKYGDLGRLPHDLFVSKSLVSLKLYGRILSDVSFPVYLPRLKIFHLEFAWSMHDEFLGNLLTGCPLLECLHCGNAKFKRIHLPSSIHLPCLRFLHLEGEATLGAEFLHTLLPSCPVLEIMELKDFEPKWSKNVSICIPTLECLRLDLWSSNPAGYKLEIIAPALKDLWVRFHSDFNGETARNFPNLEKASFDSFSQSARDLLGSVRNAKILELSCGGRGYGRLPEDIELIPKFQYLELLQIRDSFIFAHCLPEIFENSPNLKELIIKREPLDRVISWSPPPLVPHCLLHTLKAFSINYFRGMNGEMRMLNYILTNAHMLEKVKVEFSKPFPDVDQKLHVQEKLSAITRCSSTSQLQFF